ncbi:glycoside hydrolase family 127 protein [Microbacterium rhizomatis]|nr:beta-L-arabinofuranosidase domain-containing protein [Microbacterium rhizomatis]
MLPAVRGHVGPVGAVAGGAVQAVTGARFAPGFHAELVARNRAVTILHGIRMLEHAGNLRNLRRLVGAYDGPFEGPRFADSDVYKTLEAIAWELGHQESEELRRFYDENVTLLIDAQREDGYLDSAYQRGEPFGEPWSDFAHGHELYCLGHLVQAAIAGVRALGDERLLGVAQRFVALVDRLFGGDDSPVYCGHPEIETALVELYRLTGDERALHLAEAFVRRRGSGFVAHGDFGPQYYQDDASVVETATMRGHAVRAMYLNAGVVDLHLETGDSALWDAVARQWADLIAHRLYLTGGTGSRHRDEAFGDAYELPSERAYAETCAGIALMNWAWRMYLASGRADYVDVMERCLYNVVLAGISESGDRFFYSNPLQLRSDHGASQQESAGTRLDWFWCACCPPNLMRVFATLEHVMFARRDDEIQVAHFGNAALALDGGGTLEMRSDFPSDGRLLFSVAGDAGAATLAVRMPAWSEGCAVVRVDGLDRPTTAVDGWLHLGALAVSSNIEVEFAMDPVVWRAHPGADALRGTVAVTRGPLVYCADQADNTLDVERIVVPTDPVFDVELGQGLGTLLRLEAQELDVSATSSPLYVRADAPAPIAGPAEVALVLRAYATWGNGGPGVHAMKVWLPRG